MKPLYWLAGAAFSLSASIGLAATPGANTPPLSAILQGLESQPGQIVEAELDDGLWEIKQCQTDGCQKLYVDPASGKEIRRRPTDMERLPPRNARPLSAIVKQVEGQKQGRIVEAEYDDGLWEIDLRQGRQVKQKLRFDPVSGKQLR